MSNGFKKIKGGVTAPQGFLAGAVYVGIKKSNKDRRDMALIYSEKPAAGAGVFTTNRVKAAPVKVSQAHIRSAETRAIIANSGNANACTGVAGIDHAKCMARAVADCLGIRERQVLVCSTGRIGVPMPIDLIERNVLPLTESISRTGGRKAARAIMTSDTFPKECAVELELSSGKVRVGGMAKGAGMIDPNMATMLCFLSTDAAVEKRVLQTLLAKSVEQSFNRITIDGDMSTNDTVLMMANGAAGGAAIGTSGSDLELLQKAVNHVTLQLARMIVQDGEGVSKFVEVHVQGAATYLDARKAAEAIANSTLVKCAWSGNDPNWGRIVDAVGYSGARIREELIDVYYDGLIAVRNGEPVGAPPAKLKKVVSKKEFKILVDLHVGKASHTVYTTDLTTEYVVLNQSE
jgi:glutamate N-acetyltransferase / amino-acid N-acetyltransferase